MDTFIQAFRNIDGKTLNDKQKNFNALLEHIPPDHDTLIASIVPRNNFENLLKLKLLLKLQRIPDLIQILKNDDEYLPVKLLKNRWFCKQLAAILDERSEGFVENLLPYTSYVIRRRIIAKLATFGTKLDRLFDEIRALYGIHNAAPLLVACSNEKVANIFESDEKIVLAPLFQKLLYDKHPLLFSKHVKNNLNKLDNVEPSAISYIAKCNMNDFQSLVTEFDYFNAKLGKHLTRKILIDHKDLVIEKSHNFSSVLRIKTVIKMLSETEFKNFFSNCFPPDFHNSRYCWHVGTNICKQLGDRYYRYLFEIFSEKYNKSLYDFPDTISEEVIGSMTTEERLKWIAIKMNSGKTDNGIPFMKTCDSIPVIKNKIKVTSSIDKRGDLVRELLNICKINKDLNALAEVCEYVSHRHRHDDESILAGFLYELHSSFQLEQLDERHWKSINKIVEILCRKSSEEYQMYDFQLEYMEFLYRHKKLDDNGILNFFKSVGYRPHQKCSDELKKVLFLKNIDYVPILLKQDEKLEYEDLKLICCILDWNHSHKQEKIEIFAYSRLVSSLEKCLLIAEENEYDNSELTGLNSVFDTFICTNERSSFRDILIERYFLMSSRFHNLNIDFWLLKNDPDIIDQHFDMFLDHMINKKPSVSLLNFMKTYTNSDFQRRVISHCLGVVKDREVVFETLAILDLPEKFLQVIAPFYPSSDKIEDESEDEQNPVRIALAIVKSLRYVSNTLVLPALVTYCRGDYLRYSLESLYYRFYHSPENRLRAFLNDLSSKAVSVRKHSIFLTCIVGNVPDVQNILKNFIKTEKNISVLKDLCTATWRYFVKNPTDGFWEDLKVCMTKLDKNDTESFNMLVKLDHIPKKYQSRYVIFAWEIFKKSEDKHRPRLLSSIPRELFADFPLEFLLGVISENLFKPGASCETTINDFVVSCLVQSVHKNEVANLVFDIMKTLDISKSQFLEKEKSNREMLSDFVSSIQKGLTAETNNFDTLRAFSTQWHALFPPLGLMREHLRLSFALLYLESGKDLVKVATPLAHFFENFVSTYSLVLIDCFASELVNCLKVCLGQYGNMGEDFFRLCLHLVKLENLIFQLLVVKMLPGKQPSRENAKQLYLEIVQFLRNVQLESIQVLMNLYVTDLE